MISWLLSLGNMIMIGRITTYLPSGGPFVRMHSHVYPDYVVPPSYDSLLGKLVVWAPTREKAIERMKRALNDTVITGAVLEITMEASTLYTREHEGRVADIILLASFMERKFLGEEHYILEDEDYLSKYKCKLKDAVLRAKAKPCSLLNGYHFFLARHIQPSFDILSTIIESAGGDGSMRTVYGSVESKT